MSIKIVTGDLLDKFDAGEFTAIVHCCNCFHTFGAGIASVIRKRYPKAYEADMGYKRSGDKTKLGECSVCKLDQGYIFNLYGQYNTSLGRAMNYEAVYCGLELIKKTFLMSEMNEHNTVFRIGFPYGVASDLAGGSWRIVEAMITHVFNHPKFEVTIVRLPTAKELE